MKKALVIIIALLMLAMFKGSTQKVNAPELCTTDVTLNKNYSKASALQSIMDSAAIKGIPGISLALYSETEGWWAGSAGYSKLETKTPMNICNLQYLQSVSKTYMAVAILQLHEEGKIELDAVMTKYLPEKHTRFIKNANKITVRMLLNHTSGVAEYNSHPKYTSYVILNPLKVFPVENTLEFLKDEAPQFIPGSHYRYTNTNFLLLAMMADVITGDHSLYIRQKILHPLKMNHSYYNPQKTNTNYPGLTDSYWDVLGEGRPANISPMQQANVAPLKGDDGVISTTTDAIKFLKGLMEGKLLQESSMKLMMQWVNNDSGKPTYGLGLIHFDLEGIIGYGHGGGGLGAGCLLIYVPSKKVYIFLAVNIGVLFDGPVTRSVDEMKNKILTLLLQ